MRVTLHLDLDEIDYLAIIKFANYMQMPTDEFIRTAIKEYVKHITDEAKEEAMKKAKENKHKDKR